MPFVFTSWSACTDPAGNTRTLDWSEAGMRGQPPGLYLEALRQAAGMRARTDGGYGLWLDPGEFVPGHAIVRLYALLNYVDTVAWRLNVGETWRGWVDPAAVADIAGQSAWNAWPAVMQTEADLLAAAGHAARIPLPRSAVGPLNGAYLRQLRDVLSAKRVHSLYGDLAGTASIWRIGRTWVEDGTPLWADAAADFMARPWQIATLATPGCQVYGRAGFDGAIDIQRYAGDVWWGVYSPTGCRHATCYLYAEPQGDTYRNTDYPTLAESAWSRYIDDQALAYDAAEWFGLIDDPGTEPPGGLPYNCGYRIRRRYTVCDYRDDFTLGA